MDPSTELRDRLEGSRLLVREARAGVVAVSGDDGAADHLGQPEGGLGPVERIAVVEEGDRAALEQVAGEHHVGARHADHDVMVGMSSTEVSKLDPAPADVDRRRLGEDPIGRVDHDLGEIGGQAGLVGCDPGPSGLAGSFHEPRTGDVTPDRRRPEDMVAKGVIEVTVGVDHDRHRLRGECPEVVQDLARLDVGGTRVDHEHGTVAQHHADVLVVERVAPDEHVVADLGPGWHGRIVAASPDAYAAHMPSIVSHVSTADGTDLLVRHRPADDVATGHDATRPSWACVLLVHGLGDHSGRYEHVGDQLAAAGLDTWAFDLRGNGGSGGRRGDVERWSQLHDDLAERLVAVRQVAGDRPVVLYGHSMGTLLVLGYLLTDRPRPDLVIASAPALDSTLAGWKKALARLLGRVAPTLRIANGIDGRTLSRDPAVGAKAAADPLISRASTARFGAEGLAEQARVRREYRNLPAIPILALHGLDDGLVPSSASERLAELPNVERRTYPGLRHELHNEPEGRAILDEVIAWIRERATIPAQPNTASGERLAR